MEVQGKIISIGEVLTVGDGGFRKREIAIETNEQYPQKLGLEFVQDRCALLDNFALGQDVEISVNIRGREWTNQQGEVKYFNSLQGWKIKLLGEGQPNPLQPKDDKDVLPF